MTVDLRRPRGGATPPEGYEYVAVPDTDWRLVNNKNCRRPFCLFRSVAEFRRGKSGWWAYCADHLYGRWIEDGQVMEWRLTRLDAHLRGEQ